MRVTAKELYKNMIEVANKRYSDLADLQEQIATGRRLRRPSDDPVDVANTLLMTTKQKELMQFKNNIEDAIGYMTITESAMESMNTLMQRLRELAIQASSDTLSGRERIFINKEVEQLMRQLIALVNTKFKDDYVFNGTETKIPPVIIESSKCDEISDYTDLKMAYFNASGLPVGSTVQLFNGAGEAIRDIIPGTLSLSIAGTTYNENVDFTIDYETGTITILNPALAIDVTPGSPNYDITHVNLKFDYLTRGKDAFGQTVSNRGVIEREIESGIKMQINIGMDEMITDSESGNSLFNTIIRFGEALVQNNQTEIAATISRIDNVFGALLSAQSKTGARMNRLQITLTRNENQYTETTSLRANLEDAEMAETISKFMLNENVYQAALQAIAKVIQPSLVNFL
ncbi:MAG: flagellar hook-associated protein FlgL [Chitinispirillaceae bacterium]|nr:flagellar hook-associated protein FlgL [Chitinispirillaceae bacterium]